MLDTVPRFAAERKYAKNIGPKRTAFQTCLEWRRAVRNARAREAARTNDALRSPSMDSSATQKNPRARLLIAKEATPTYIERCRADRQSVALE